MTIPVAGSIFTAPAEVEPVLETPLRTKTFGDAVCAGKVNVASPVRVEAVSSDVMRVLFESVDSSL